MTETVRTRVQNRDLWDKFWKDKHGQVVVWQRPNILLIGWLVLTLISLFTNNTVANVFWYAALAVLAGWAILEVWKGVNYLRRSLGIIVLALIIIALFKLA